MMATVLAAGIALFAGAVLAGFTAAPHGAQPLRVPVPAGTLNRNHPARARR